MNELTKLAPQERSRTYHFADGTSQTFRNVTALGVTKSGFHKLEADGGKFIVAPGWRFITLDVDTWTL